jgi:hypothetical protein
MLRNRAERKLRMQVIELSFRLAELRQSGKMLGKSYQRLVSKRLKLQQALKAEGKAAA